MGKDPRSSAWGWAAAVALTVAVVLLLGGGPAEAKKPPKPPPDPTDPGDVGVIYVKQADLCVMAQDGTGLAKLSAVDYAAGVGYHPSHALHDGERWFLQLQSVTGVWHPDSKLRFDLYAVSESGTTVLLCDDPDLELRWPGPARWAADAGVADGKVSLAAKKWVQDPDTEAWSVAEWGIYIATLDPADLATANGALDLAWTRLPITFTGTSIGFDWAPDGTSIAYVEGLGDEEGLFRADEGLGSWSTTQLTTYGEFPRWSNDGMRIAFHSDSGIHAMDSDGTEVTTVVPDPADTNRFTRKAVGPRFSPNDTHLVYLYTSVVSPGAKQNSWDVRRVKVDGTSDVNLTESVDGYVGIVGWRAD